MAKGKRRNKKIKSPQTNPKFVKAKQPDNLFKGLSRGSVHEQMDKLTYSFRHLDESQGDTIKDWQSKGILAEAFATLRDYSSNTISEALGAKFKIYGDFPPKEKTDFSHPRHVPPDAQWASMHVTGRVCIAGHVVNSTFFIVFLDSEHRFWISKLKGT